MSGKKGYISRDQQNKNQPLFLTFILRTFDKNFAQLQGKYKLIWHIEQNYGQKQKRNADWEKKKFAWRKKWA